MSKRKSLALGQVNSRRKAFYLLGLFFLFWYWFADRNIGVASLFLEAPAQVIVTTVHRASATLTCDKIVPMLGLDFVAANITADGILDDQFTASLAILL